MGERGRVRAIAMPERPRGLDYFRVPVNLYHEGDLIEEDLYILYQGQYVLYRLKNLPWKREDGKHLEDFGIQDLYIKCQRQGEHARFLEAHLSRILDQPKIPITEKAQILYTAASSIVEDIFTSPLSSESLRRSVGTVKHSIDYLSKDRGHFFELMSLASRDFSEYTHALHTATYAITLARQMGLKIFNQISALGIASLLHDVGKVKIDPVLLGKVEPLTESERREVERHPEYGYELVHSLGGIPELSEQIILQHHERPNGKGYPRKTAEDLHLFVRIVSLVDCFDSLTSERPYQKSVTPLEAIELMRGELKEEYDQNLLVEFIKMLKR